MSATSSEQRRAKTTTSASAWKSAPLVVQAEKDHRQEDHAGGQGRGNDGAGDLAGPDPRRLLGRQPGLLALAHDALENDDGAVDDETDAEGEPAEGHLVEGHAANRSPQVAITEIGIDNAMMPVDDRLRRKK